MKKLLSIVAFTLVFNLANAQYPLAKKTELKTDASVLKQSQLSDTLIVSDQFKFIKMPNGEVYQVAAFKFNVPVFLKNEEWSIILNIVNERSYRDIPALSISNLITKVSNQLPQK
ncbi:MAG: hypothetical protein EAZ35_02125 [Sphingobacteriia bacterium]|nr:MAG: hypothetical protein EAZ35_02125 [Sphingobacteriia bacterium]